MPDLTATQAGALAHITAAQFTALVEAGHAPSAGAGGWSKTTITHWAREEITASQAATIAGVKPRTFLSYVYRGQAPAPDPVRGGKPFWRRRVIVHWVSHRPGAGARTDLRE